MIELARQRKAPVKTEALPAADGGYTPRRRDQRQRLPLAASPSGRLRALVGLLDRRLRHRLTAQLAKLTAITIGIGYTITLIAVAAGGAGDNSDIVVKNALVWLSWLVAGLVALASAAPELGDVDSGTRALATLRGHSKRSFVTARALATARRIWRLTFPTTLILSLAALAAAGSISLLLPRLLFLLGALLYIALLSLTLALLVELARALNPERARSLLLLLVLLPHVMRAVAPSLRASRRCSAPCSSNCCV